MEVDGDDEEKIGDDDVDAQPASTNTPAEEDGDDNEDDGAAEPRQPTKPAAKPAPIKPLLAAKKAPLIKARQPKPLIAAAKSAFGPKKGKPLLLPKARSKEPASADDRKATKADRATDVDEGSPSSKRRRIGSTDSEKTAVNSDDDVDMAKAGDAATAPDEDDIAMPRTQSVSQSLARG